MKKAIVFALCCACYVSAAFAIEERQGRQIIMGYNSSAKAPLIETAPDNSGAYIDLYTRLASKIGYELKVVRFPKKRVHLLLKQGKIDFYPGMKFTTERAEYSYFIPNGLPTGRTGISRSDMSEITGLSQLRGKRVVLPFDGIDYTAGTEGIIINRVRQLDIQKAYELLVNKRTDFYATDDVVVATFLKENGITNIKMHPEFLPRKMMTLGFSRFSPYFEADKNPAYDASREAGIDNDPAVLTKGSVPYKMQQALKEMIADGEIDAIYHSYYGLE